jgi:hypothetical protein
MFRHPVIRCHVKSYEITLEMRMFGGTLETRPKGSTERRGLLHGWWILKVSTYQYCRDNGEVMLEGRQAKGVDI